MCEYGWGQRKIKGLVDHNHHNLHLHDINFSYNIHLQGIFWPYGMIFHKPRLPWNTRIYCTKPPFKVRSCEVAIIWPGLYISTTLQETTSNKSPWKYPPCWMVFTWISMGDFHGRKCEFQRRGYQGFPQFSQQNLGSHGPYDPSPTRSSLHWERLSAISSDAACAGVL